MSAWLGRDDLIEQFGDKLAARLLARASHTGNGGEPIITPADVERLLAEFGDDDEGNLPSDR